MARAAGSVNRLVSARTGPPCFRFIAAAEDGILSAGDRNGVPKRGMSGDEAALKRLESALSRLEAAVARNAGQTPSMRRLERENRRLKEALEAANSSRAAIEDRVRDVSGRLNGRDRRAQGGAGTVTWRR